MRSLKELAASILCAYALCTSTSMAQHDNAIDVMVEISHTAIENRLRLDFDGAEFSGQAWERLVSEAAQAQFVMIGEEHGIAENPMLVAQLFHEISDYEYKNLVIETSPAMAKFIDGVLLRDGLEGLRNLYAKRGGEPAFFGMHEEALLLAAARETSSRKKPVLIGVDYEVASDPVLLRVLSDKRKPQEAEEALDLLIAASDAAWKKYYQTSGPQFIFSFSGDPELVRAVEDAWPERDEEAAWILDTLEETLEINKLWVNRQAWQSNARRAAFIRSNFLRHWNDRAKNDGGPKMIVKLGASHLVRGRNMVETFDLGALLPELAEINGTRALSIMVLPGAGSMTAVLDPTTWTFREAPGKDSYAAGLEVITATAYEDAFTLIDLRPIRSHLTPSLAKDYDDLARIVHGFDMLLVLSGSTASAEFDHVPPSRDVE